MWQRESNLATTDLNWLNHKFNMKNFSYYFPRFPNLVFLFLFNIRSERRWNLYSVNCKYKRHMKIFFKKHYLNIFFRQNDVYVCKVFQHFFSSNSESIDVTFYKKSSSYSVFDLWLWPFMGHSSHTNYAGFKFYRGHIW